MDESLKGPWKRRESVNQFRIKEDTIQRIAINIAITFKAHAYTVVPTHPNIHQQLIAPNGGYRLPTLLP
jgi:hypothetical protein